jgi:chemotaxis protein CheX
MKMELIQPFISAADAVLAQTLGCSTKVADVSMDDQGHRRQGVAALVAIRGDIEGRVILDLESVTAVKALAGAEVQESAEIVRETVCELANMVIGNAVTLLNDQGFHFKVAPPEVHASEDGLHGSRDTEALVMCFDTPHGSIFLNIAMRYNRRRSRERATLVTD